MNNLSRAKAKLTKMTLRAIPIIAWKKLKFLKPYKQAVKNVNHEIFVTNKVIKIPDPFLNIPCILINEKDQNNTNKKYIYLNII